MDLQEAMEKRHSVRTYTAQKITGDVKEMLQQMLTQCNGESGLHMQLVLEEPKAFDSFMAHYGKFSGVQNYIAMVGPKGDKLEELCGYYGEKNSAVRPTIRFEHLLGRLDLQQSEGRFSDWRW